MKSIFIALFTTALSACSAHSSKWQLLLSHDADGVVSRGDEERLVSAVRQGCQLRVAWGARRKIDASQTIEHIAEPIWVSVRNGQKVEVQVGDFLANLSVLGEPSEDHPRRERFGGTDKVIKWRAILKTDGSFNAVWYQPSSGDFVTRAPQNHPMRWFADCQPASPSPLFSE